MSLIRDEDRCCRIIGISSVVSSLSLCYLCSVLVLRVCSRCCACCVHSAASPSPLCGHWARALCPRYLCERLFPSHVAFCTELRVYGFLQGENNRQPASNGANRTKSNDQIGRPQHCQKQWASAAPLSVVKNLYVAYLVLI